MADEGPFVIATRYVNSKGRIIRHVYGPYPTRSKANTQLRRMLRQVERDFEWLGQSRDDLEIHVVKMYGERS